MPRRSSRQIQHKSFSRKKGNFRRTKFSPLHKRKISPLLVQGLENCASTLQKSIREGRAQKNAPFYLRRALARYHRSLAAVQHALKISRLNAASVAALEIWLSNFHGEINQLQGTIWKMEREWREKRSSISASERNSAAELKKEIENLMEEKEAQWRAYTSLKEELKRFIHGENVPSFLVGE